MSLFAAVLAWLLSALSCWNLYDAAMSRSAQSVRPHFISYDEDIDVRAHGESLVRERAHVEYRDDGLALLLDDRYGPDPVLTYRLEPGPPVLGPYGGSRAGWLSPADAPQLHTVADVRVSGDETCENAGLVTLDGKSAYHLLFHRPDSSSAGLKELWIESASSRIERAIVTGVLQFTGSQNAASADFDVRVTHVNGFDVVSQVTWSRNGYEGDYTYENYAFPPSIAALESASTPIR